MSRPFRPSMLLLAALLIVSACGGDPDQPVSQPLDPTTAPGLPTAGDDPAAGGAMPALPPQRAVHEEVVDATPRPFEEALYDETDDSLHVIYSTGVEPCYVLGGIEVVEESEQVTVTLTEGYLPDESGEAPICIEIAEQVSATVPLEQPLGDRALVDGATGEQVPVSVIREGDAPSS